MRSYLIRTLAALVFCVVWTRSEAGALYGVQCFANAQEAARAWCLDAAQPKFSNGVARSHVQPSATVGKDVTTAYNAVSVTTCTAAAASGQTSAVTFAAPLFIEDRLHSEKVAGTGYTWPALTSSFTQWTWTGPAIPAKTLTFPACDVAPTSAEQVNAVLALWPYGLALVATAWGLAFVRRRIVRWNESSNNGGDE